MYNGKIKKPYTPFSNGTQAMNWYCNNCDKCTKSWHPDQNKPYPKESTIANYVSQGKYCKLQYWIDLGFILGEIPLEIAEQIGFTSKSYSGSCMMFSDNEDDGYKPPKRPRPDNTPDNQLVLPFLTNEILENFKHKTTKKTLQLS